VDEGDLEEEDVEEAGVVLSERKTWNVGHVGEWGIYQENAQSLNASYATKKVIRRNFALGNQ